MLNTSEKIIKHKTGLLNLAEELGNVPKCLIQNGMKDFNLLQVVGSRA